MRSTPGNQYNIFTAVKVSRKPKLNDLWVSTYFLAYILTFTTFLQTVMTFFTIFTPVNYDLYNIMTVKIVTHS
jgi:hypothetical protein